MSIQAPRDTKAEPLLASTGTHRNNDIEEGAPLLGEQPKKKHSSFGRVVSLAKPETCLLVSWIIFYKQHLFMLPLRCRSDSAAS